MANEARAMYAAPGYLVFASGNTLVAQHFDLSRFQLKGDPIPIGEVLANREMGRAAFSVSHTGELAYRSPPQKPHQVISCDRQGQCVPVGERTRLTNLTLSPDDRYLALTTFDNALGENLWLLQLENRTVAKAPVPASPSLGQAVWSTDSAGYAVAEGMRTRVRFGDIAGGTRPLFTSQEPRKWLDSWSPDGRFLLLHDAVAIYRLPADGKGNPEKLAAISNVSSVRLSPDGRRVAFAVSGPHPQVYMAEFPSFDQKVAVSEEDACQPSWRKDGEELFYLSPRDGNLMALRIGSRGGSAERLFRPGVPLACNWSQYAVSHDGQRIYAYQLNVEPERPAISTWSSIGPPC